MKIAISELKNKCPEEIKKELRFLKGIKKLKKILKGIKVDEISRKLFKKRFENINYKELIFRDGKWVKKTSKFIL